VLIRSAYYDRQNRKFTDFILMKSASNFGKSTMVSVKKFLGMDTSVKEVELDQQTIDSNWNRLAGALKDLK